MDGFKFRLWSLTSDTLSRHMAIFVIGIPAIRYVFPAAIVLGGGIALVLHFIRHETTGAPWIRSANKK
jgi:hypothetical protein